jgi:hypothetical protein
MNIEQESEEGQELREEQEIEEEEIERDCQAVSKIKKNKELSGKC